MPLLSPMLLRSIIISIVFMESHLLFSNDTIQNDALDQLYQTQIPKKETQASAFIEEHSTFDGRETIIAVFDTGVDPGAPGMQTTTTGSRKLVDIIDASGAGDVDTSTIVQSKNGKIVGLTGRNLILPTSIANPSKEFRIGAKYGQELFHDDVNKRVRAWRKKQLSLSFQQAKADGILKKHTTSDPEKSETPRMILNKTVLRTEFEKYQKERSNTDKGPYFDCLLWNDGTNWNAIIDTNENGDLRDETILRPFGIAGEYGKFPDHIALNFGIQVYKEGDLLSIVTTSGSHGTHVASIASAHFPENTKLNGIAPGAKVLSIRIGDVRIDGSSVYTGESRAVATAAQYEVDVMNASWGGQSLLQDGTSWANILYNQLVENYNVTAFVSAGNDGPALSTLGSPGGEARAVIGVGAYISPDMGKYLYSIADESPETMFGFSARGPTRNGNTGVDIVAPGAATTSLALDSLHGSDRYNGTSMSAPSAAGVGALLISAAKQSGVPYSPSKIRYALKNTAKSLHKKDILSQGSGLIQTINAWNYLKNHQSTPELNLFYDVEVIGGTFTNGPGLYLREDLPMGIKTYQVNLEPVFPDHFTNQQRYEFNTQLSVNCDANWIKVPEFVHLSNAGNEFLIEINFETLQQKELQAPILSSIRLSPAANIETGSIIEIPITIITGNHRINDKNRISKIETSIDASETFRKFIKVPENANHLSIQLTRKNDNAPRKRFVLSALTLARNQDIKTWETQKYIRLNPGESDTIEIPTIPGETMELSLHQGWAYDQETDLSITGKWKGLESDTNAIFLDGVNAPSEMSIEANDSLEFEIEASLTHAVYKYSANPSEITPGDKRGFYPAKRADTNGIQSFWLTNEYHLDLPKEETVYFDNNEYYTEFNAGGGIVEIYDSDGLKVASIGAFGDSDQTVTLPKGKVTIIQEYTSTDLAVLERLKTIPLTVTKKIEPIELPTYLTHKAYIQGKKSSLIRMKRSRNHSLFVTSPKKYPISKEENSPLYLSGNISFSSDHTEIETFPLIYQPTPDTSEKETNAISKNENPSKSWKGLNTEIYETQLKFLKATRSSPSESKQLLLTSLLNNGTNDPNLWLEEIYSIALDDGLIHPWVAGIEDVENKLPEKRPNKLLQKIEELISQCQPSQTAQYFGSAPTIDENDFKNVAAQKLELEKYSHFRKSIAEAYLIAIDANMIAKRFENARSLVNEARRWNADKTHTTLLAKLEILLLIEENLHALALEAIGELSIKQDPQIEVWKDRIYKELEWDQLTTNQIPSLLKIHAEKLR